MDCKYDQIRYLMGFSDKYSDFFTDHFWSKAELLRESNLLGTGLANVSWPEKCYMPEQVWESLFVSENIPLDIFNENRHYFSSMAAWTSSLTTYRIDKDSFFFAYGNSLPDKLPVDDIINFVDGACFFELLNCSNVESELISIDYDINKNLYVLKIFQKRKDRQIPFSIELGDWSLDEGVRRGLSRHYEIPNDEMDSSVEFVISWVESVLKLIMCIKYNQLSIVERDNKSTKDLMRKVKHEIGIKEFDVFCKEIN